MRLVPTVVQDAGSGEVLMLAYSSKDSLQKTLSSKKAWFFSRSREKLWQKGESSGNEMAVVSASFDCDKDALLFQVRVEGRGVACHTGKQSCFDCNLLKGEKVGGAGFFEDLFRVIKQRRQVGGENSFVASIVNDRRAVARKLREETEELIEALDEKSDEDVAWEAADLLFFSLVALASRSVELNKVVEELEKRRK
ncbi:MAG: bifunctional phosphoribosyl-AMP cyclohydrolase/phosphoribosyl-ATP diphosphatase HisIE [Candidatus Micrarchaeia archaeon]